MDIDSLILALSIASAGYFMGDGLKNFKNPNAKSLLDSLADDEEPEFTAKNMFMTLSEFHKKMPWH